MGGVGPLLVIISLGAGSVMFPARSMPGGLPVTCERAQKVPEYRRGPDIRHKEKQLK